MSQTKDMEFMAGGEYIFLCINVWKCSDRLSAVEFMECCNCGIWGCKVRSRHVHAWPAFTEAWMWEMKINVGTRICNVSNVNDSHELYVNCYKQYQYAIRYTITLIFHCWWSSTIFTEISISLGLGIDQCISHWLWDERLQHFYTLTVCAYFVIYMHLNVII